jgi:class 3 adenylate cyclase
MNIRKKLMLAFVFGAILAILQFWVSGSVWHFVKELTQPHTEGSDEVRAQMLSNSLRWTLYIAGAFVLLLSVVGASIMRRISRGCGKLEKAVEEFGKGNLDHRVTGMWHDELGIVGTQMNIMADRLQESEARIREQTAEIKKQQELAESLLLNVLPSEVAEELKLKGAVDPRYHADVTILFTDFKGFTASTETMAAEELVNALHAYFTAFDRIAQQFGLEKLKTIGDSYMAVAGLTERKPSHAVDAVLAAFAMVEEMVRGRNNGLPDWSVRIGVHTGPVISGVVGIRKFAFDIWGESVNFASRMESSGSPNRINLSASTYNRVKDFFECEPRGAIKTKEGREYEMYFASTAVRSLLAQPGTPPPLFAERYRKYFQHELPGYPPVSAFAQSS